MRKLIIAIVAVTLLASGCAKKAAEQEIKKPTGGAGQVFELKSSAFDDGQKMPAKYANTGVSGGENVSIPLSWQNPPDGTKSFAIALVDRHPVADNFVHWLVINIPANVSSVPEGASGTNNMPAGSRELNTTYGVPGYGGPRPPAGSGDHDYETTVYALSVDRLDIDADAGLSGFLAAIEGKVLASAKVSGLFGR